MVGTEVSEGDEAERPDLWDKLLSFATEVHPGEALGALLLSLNVFLLLSAYYLIKPVREAFILVSGGAEVKSYASAGQVLLFTAILPLYGRLVALVSRQKLITRVTLFFMACLVAFYFAAVARAPFLGVAFFLFVGIFNVMILAQFWGYAADLYRPEQGERLFPIVALGGSVGAVVGSRAAAEVAERLPPSLLLLVSAAILGATIFVTRSIEKRMAPSSEHGPIARRAKVAEHPIEDAGTNPFLLVVKNPYLLLIAGLMLMANIVNTTGEFILGSVVSTWAEGAEKAGKGAAESLITVFYSDFFFWVNLIGFIVQLLLVSRIIKWIGVRGALLVLPLIALSSYIAIALLPVLLVVRLVKTVENATDYSLNNTVRGALYLPVSREEKYKAKQVIDTFFVRGGDVASAGVVAAGLHSFHWEAAEFAWFNVGAIFVWSLFALSIGRRYARLAHLDDSARSVQA